MTAKTEDCGVKIGGHWDGRRSGDFAEIAKVLLPVVKKDIILKVPHGNSGVLAEDGKFHILIWSSPSGQPILRTPKTMWGIAVDCMDHSFAPSGFGMPIITKENWIAGELVGEAYLYIHHDICHEGTANELAIFRLICEETAKALARSPEERKQIIAELEMKRAQMLRTLFTQTCRRNLPEVIRMTKEDIADTEERVERFQIELVEMIRNARDKRQQLAQLEAQMTSDTGKYEQEFDALIKTPGIEKVEVAGEMICLHTEHIYIPLEKTKTALDIGKMRIDIYINGSKGGVRIFNLTSRGRGSDRGLNIIHPHVGAHGDVCLGNISKAVPELIANYEFTVLANMLLQFLKSAELERHEDPTRYWPIVEWPLKEAAHG